MQYRIIIEQDCIKNHFRIYFSAIFATIMQKRRKKHPHAPLKTGNGTKGIRNTCEKTQRQIDGACREIHLGVRRSFQSGRYCAGSLSDIMETE